MAVAGAAAKELIPGCTHFVPIAETTAKRDETLLAEPSEDPDASRFGPRMLDYARRSA